MSKRFALLLRRLLPCLAPAFEGSATEVGRARVLSERERMRLCGEAAVPEDGSA